MVTILPIDNARAADPLKMQFAAEQIPPGQGDFDGLALNSVKYSSPDGRQVVGFWECAAGKLLQIEGYPHDEFGLVVKGSVTITNDDGSANTYETGDTFVIPKGWTGIWHMHAEFAKKYVIMGGEPA